ncbi:MAG: S-methyl-5-thioribose-1-phosphate isomerase [Bacteroidales bacterium]|nr:S-methyl-5-thioribose-1-phosphate isomerase [Bacteroidales bacterium]
MTNDWDICYFSDGGHSLTVLDQTLLPTEERYVELRSAAEVADAIARLVVRGAPLIGIAAAMGLCVAVANGEDFEEARRTIGAARPTAVNLSWALERMARANSEFRNLNFELRVEQLREEALKIKDEDAETCHKIGQFGRGLINDGMGVLTHCNAGHLATGHYGTALAPIYAAAEEGKQFRVYADETRPLLQGARLTAYELVKNGIDTTLICDNMAASLMAAGKIDIVFVGCDRVAANGDTANKIGTLGVAVLAKHFGVPFYVCGPQSTFDSRCATGADIVIEQRRSEEITTMHYAKPMAPTGVNTYNPSFDVTPHELITGYITENGIDTTK